jgi:hypothetical protein
MADISAVLHRALQLHCGGRLGAIKRRQVGHAFASY